MHFKDDKRVTTSCFLLASISPYMATLLRFADTIVSITFIIMELKILHESYTWRGSGVVGGSLN